MQDDRSEKTWRSCPCTTPPSGGACPSCNYPRAYAHPTSLLDAFYVDAVYIQGTAIMIYPDPGISPGLVQVVQRDGSQREHAIPPPSPGEGQPHETAGKTSDSPRADHPESMRGRVENWTRIVENWMTKEQALLELPKLSPLAALGTQRAADLMTVSACLLRASANVDLAGALAEGVASLIQRSSHYPSVREQLHRVLGTVESEGVLHPRVPAPNESEHREIPSIEVAVRTLLRELDRADRIQDVTRAPSALLVDDRRTRVAWSGWGPFSRPVARIRIALLPGEAEHVRIYDVRIGKQDDFPLGISVLDRLPGYAPDTVREGGPPVDLGSHVTRRYLPGSILAGQLREGAKPWDPEDPYGLSPDDLLGGAWIELAAPSPPMSHACLIYEVDPEHAMVAVVEPG